MLNLETEYWRMNFIQKLKEFQSLSSCRIACDSFLTECRFWTAPLPEYLPTLTQRLSHNNYLFIIIAMHNRYINIYDDKKIDKLYGRVISDPIFL